MSKDTQPIPQNDQLRENFYQQIRDKHPAVLKQKVEFDILARLLAYFPGSSLDYVKKWEKLEKLGTDEVNSYSGILLRILTTSALNIDSFSTRMQSHLNEKNDFTSEESASGIEELRYIRLIMSILHRDQFNTYTLESYLDNFIEPKTLEKVVETIEAQRSHPDNRHRINPKIRRLIEIMELSMDDETKIIEIYGLYKTYFDSAVQAKKALAQYAQSAIDLENSLRAYSRGRDHVTK